MTNLEIIVKFAAIKELLESITIRDLHYVEEAHSIAEDAVKQLEEIKHAK